MSHQISLAHVAARLRATLGAVGLTRVALRLDHDLDAVIALDQRGLSGPVAVAGVGVRSLAGLPELDVAWVLVRREDAPYSTQRGDMVPFEGPHDVDSAARAVVRRLVESRLSAAGPSMDHAQEPEHEDHEQDDAQR